MPSSLNRNQVKKYLKNFDLRPLFVEELGWDNGGDDMEVVVAERSFVLKAIAHKRGMIAYQHVADSSIAFPDHVMRLKIEKSVSKTVREHIIVYVTHDKTSQYWQWVKREPSRPDRPRFHIYHLDQPGEALIQKLEHIAFTLEEESDLTIVDVSGRVRAAFDVENVTRKFYERFKNEHDIFVNFIDGIKIKADREWYASLILNRMMFIYFVQKRGFLDGDVNYLRNRLEHMQKEHGKDHFQTFYRLFLLRLFHEGLGKQEADRTPELVQLLGKVPYLNGGFFEVHNLEQENREIHIPDEAFQRIFDFFDSYQWHLDDRPLHNDTEINPDVLGYIFEKYINQKQMGAYYTNEDITGYISRNTVIPYLVNQAMMEYPTDLIQEKHLLSDNPDRYIFESARHGITYDLHKKQTLAVKRQLPPDIAAGLDDVSKRGEWNKAAPIDYALPAETWREHITRRHCYEDVYTRLTAGKVTAINDLITYNLDIEKFAQDIIAGSEKPELVQAFWKAITKVSVLDPTCGSGAFLFAALNILEPMYIACLESMRSFVDDQKRNEHRHDSKIIEDFHNILNSVSEHSSEPYYILKSIIVNNLYGVDIMEEAVEICKLRLFLVLVAQLETYDQIEPLPDIDFNIRAGNTLVGFSSIKEIESILSTDMVKMLTLPDIMNRAEVAERTFQNFQAMQTSRHVNVEALTNAKSELKEKLDCLRTELDEYMANEFDIKIDDETAYEKWLRDYQPFHWLVEFHGIMHDGGFDVIIGNPPYLETKDVSYSTKSFTTENSRAIHAMCIERSLALCKEYGCLSMILPMALVSTQRMTTVQRMLEYDRDCWYSNFGWRPGRLFKEVNRALTIFIAVKPQNNCTVFSTKYLMWKSDGRHHLFSTMRYVECPKIRNVFWIPKLGENIEIPMLEKCISIKTTMKNFIGRSKNMVYYRTTGGLYWKVFTNFAPKFFLNGVAGSSSRKTSFTLANVQHVESAVAVLSSDIFWWWCTITSNLRDLNPSVWGDFPVPTSTMNDAEIRKLGFMYIADLKKNSTMHVRNHINSGKSETQSFKVYKSKNIIEKIDKAMAVHYGFDKEELDFFINYDIKFRISSDD